MSFISWLFDPKYINSNLFTMGTVVLSGIISWIISAAYFSRGNRDALKSSVLYPMRRILEDKNSRENYRHLVELYKEYSAKYLKTEERSIIDDLLNAYNNICTYDYDQVCAESLFSYFMNKLEQNGIDIKPIPVDIDGEVVDVECPDGLLYIKDDLAAIINRYPPEYDDEFDTGNYAENCKNAVISTFNSYCKSYYTDKVITYFDDYSILEVLEKAHNHIMWNEKFETYNNAKSKFLNMKILKK